MTARGEAAWVDSGAGDVTVRALALADGWCPVCIEDNNECTCPPCDTCGGKPIDYRCGERP